MLNTIHQFFEACHPFGYPLLACSVILITAILYQWYLRLKATRQNPLKDYSMKLTAGSPESHQQELAQLKELQFKQPLARIMYFIATNKELEELPTVVESKLRQYIEDSRAGMSLIAIITNIAPMLGILGTAWGLVDIFGIFGTPGAQEGIALGISKALYTTIFGLAIAVPGIIAQTCFERSLEREAARLNEQFTYLLAQRHHI